MDQFRFSFADIGTTRQWGNPNNSKLQKIQFNYQIAPLSNEIESFDVYLVDGRYRVSCACAAMLHAMSRGGDMTKVMVAIHDFFQRRAYQDFKQVTKIVHSSDRLAVFKSKPNVTEKDIYNLWKKHAMNFD